MGIRETLNENPRLTTGITIAIIVVVFGFIAWQWRGASSQGAGAANSGHMYYFSDDDGKSYFPDDAAKIPPFNHNGKEAVRARVMRCDGKTFVNHLERFTPDAKKKLEAINAKAPGADPTAAGSIQDSGREAKLPGQGDWVKITDPKFQEIIKPHCNDINSLDEVIPGG